MYWQMLLNHKIFILKMLVIRLQKILMNLIFNMKQKLFNKIINKLLIINYHNYRFK